MAQTFKIAKASKIGEYFTTEKTKKVSETDFFEMLEDKVKEITAKQPSKYNEVFENVKSHLTKNHPVIVMNIQFSITGKPLTTKK